MIVDCFTTMGPSLRNHATKLVRPFDDTQTAEGLVAVMDRAGIERAVVFAPRWIGGDIVDPTYEQANAYVHEAAGRYPGRFLPYARVDVNYGDAAVAEVTRCLTELGFVGVAIDAEWDSVEAWDEELVDPLVRVAAEHEVPVLFESGYAPISPAVFWRIADAYPKTPIILAHMGGRLTTDAVMIAKRAPNVYLETSDHMYYLGQFTKGIGAERVLFGSNTPFSVAEAELFKVTVREDLSEDEKALILGGNAARLHGLS